MSFVHLHCHSEYSLLDGLSRIPQLVARARALGQPALALTDHGVMYGAVEFWQAATDAGIKPIIGMESYLARGKMSERLPGEDAKPYHLLLLAKNMAGYKNLLKLASLAQLEGFYYKPRIDKETLARHAEGLICTTGCLAAEIPRLLTEDRQPEKARRELGWYYDVFGPENFFLELQDHSLPELHELNRALLELAPQFKARFLATNDVHYVAPEEAGPHDVLLCIQTGKLVTDPNRMRMSDHSYYLKSREEMAALFGEFPGALDNTLLVAEMCDLNLKTRGYHLPRFEVPEGHTPQTYLRQICEAGLARRYGDRADRPEVRARLEYELKVIHDMGFDAYFLIVWDLCEFAQRKDIWWNVRGSGASSIVAYTAGITNLDPLRNSLIFERFLNPGRISMPDIDLDYPDDRRGAMIEYAVGKYGKDNVAQIITFGTLGARAAIRDVGRAMDIPLSEVDQIAKLVPAGPKVKLKDAFEIPDFKARYDEQPHIHELVDTACQLEGVSRHASTHAAGVVISDQALVEYLPLNRPTKGTDESSLGVVTQFPMEIIEKIGLLKVDFLGLATLTIMRLACDLIEQHHGRHLELNTIPYTRRPDDPAADADVRPLFDLLSSGHVDGIFQVESEGMRKVLTSMRPSEFEHIIAVVALYRPGPMEYIPQFVRRMHGEEPVHYHHPDLQSILGETYGVCVYQEQIIQIATTMAGYSPGEADQIRKAVGKKKQEEIARHRTQFIEGAVHKGYAREVAEAVYADIEFFANYGFNKAHAADYAMITCQTAYLKAHYPVEYMTALLSVSRNDTAKVALYAADARRQGIPVLPPDVNTSGLDFTIEDCPDESGGPCRPGIRFGLAAVKNVGEGAVQTILEARHTGGPFTSLDDCCQRVDLRLVGKRALECLAKVGALDAFGCPRNQLLDGLDAMLNASAGHFRAKEAGQLSLFAGLTGGAQFAGVQLPKPTSQVTRREMLGWEKELIGLYVSDHPLQPVLGDIQAVVTHYSQQLTEDHHGQPVVMAGVVTNIRTHYTKKGDLMGFVSIEDLQGHLELVIFPRTWREVSRWLVMEQLVVIYGKVDSKGSNSAKVIVDQLTREFKLTRSADTAPSPLAGLPAAAFEEAEPVPAPPQRAGGAAVTTEPARPALSLTSSPADEWDQDEPPPWWLDDLPLPSDDEVRPAVDPPAAEPAAANPAALAQPALAAQSDSQPDQTNGAAQPERAPAAEPGPNGNGRRTGNGQGAYDSRPPAPDSPAARPAAAQSPGTPAGSNGAAARRAASAPARPAPARPALRRGQTPANRPPTPAGPPGDRPNTAPQRVVVTFRTSGDKDKDKRMMRRVHGLLLSYPGDDQFEFAVFDYDDRNYQLRFPNDTTGFCPALEQDLQRLLGPGNVSVEPL